MSEAKFKTMRHIETVRNFLSAFIVELVNRQIAHDQTKLLSPEVEYLETHTSKLRGLTYGSPEYHKCLEEMAPGVEHHYKENYHHPEHFPVFKCKACGNEYMDEKPEFCECNGREFDKVISLKRMNLVDIVEMLADWKSASLRHHDGDLLRSIEINQKRYGYSDELKEILLNTAVWINQMDVYHKAEES